MNRVTHRVVSHAAASRCPLHRRPRPSGAAALSGRTLAWLAVALFAFGPPAFPQASMDEVGRGVVRVWAASERELGHGSGFVINDAGYVITNHHVIDGARVIKVMPSAVGAALADEVERRFGPRYGRERMDRLFGEILEFLVPHMADAEVVMSDPQRDFAILRTAGLRNFQPLPLSPTDRVSLGQDVRALGYPGVGDLAGAASSLQLKINDGIIRSREHVSGLDQPVYGITAEISGGNSGGPLVTLCGEVTGINTFGIRLPGEPGRADYAVRIDPVIQELRSRRIGHRVVSGPCVVGGGGGADPVGRGMLFVSLLLAMTAVGMAATARGRAAMGHGVQKVGQSVAKVRSSIGSRRRAPGTPAPPPKPRPARPVLRVLGGPYRDKVIELNDEPLVIGRDPRVSQLVFPPESDAVSKRHCKIGYSRTRRQFILEDCWSTNGTYLGSGKRLEPEQPETLRPGDRFYVGDRAFAFQVQLESRS